MTPRSRSSRAFAPSALAVAAALALLSSGAQAFEIDTGNPDLAVRWDNTVRAEPRRSRRSRAIPRSATRRCPTKAPTASTRATSVAKRLDLLSELDVVYKKRYGFRVSGAAWYDGAYGDTSQSQPERAADRIPSYVSNQYSPTPSACTTAARANCSTPSSSAASTSATCRCRPSSAATRSTGASRCSWAATCTASPTRRTRSTCRRASPRPAPKPRNCSAR